MYYRLTTIICVTRATARLHLLGDTVFQEAVGVTLSSTHATIESQLNNNNNNGLDFYIIFHGTHRASQKPLLIHSHWWC